MKKDILIIDDDEELCEEMSGILKDEGYKVAVIYDGLKAGRLIEKNKYDLLLLDMKIPGLSGLEILKRIREKKIGVKVVILTGGFITHNLPKSPMHTVKEEDELILTFADEIITKPFDIKIVLAKIKELIG